MCVAIRFGIIEIDLIIKLATLATPVYAVAAGAVVFLKVSSLAHEPFNHTMKARPLVPKSFLHGAQATEVLARQRARILE